MKQFDYLEFDNDQWYFDKKKYTKEEALAIYNEESGLDPATLDDVKEGEVCWFPKVDNYDFPNGAYIDVTNRTNRLTGEKKQYKNAFPVWVI